MIIRGKLTARGTNYDCDVANQISRQCQLQKHFLFNGISIFLFCQTQRTALALLPLLYHISDLGHVRYRCARFVERGLTVLCALIRPHPIVFGSG